MNIMGWYQSQNSHFPYPESEISAIGRVRTGSISGCMIGLHEEGVTPSKKCEKHKKAKSTKHGLRNSVHASTNFQRQRESWSARSSRPTLRGVLITPTLLIPTRLSTTARTNIDIGTWRWFWARRGAPWRPWSGRYRGFPHPCVSAESPFGG